MKAICAITPSWLITKKKVFAAGRKTLEQMGFRLLNPRFVGKLPSTRQKAKQLHAAFRNKRADLILAQRGGYGSMKLLPHLDFKLLQENPKTFAGCSDASALLNPIFEKTGLVTLHGPMLVSFSRPSKITLRSFANAVAGFPNKDLLAGVPVKVYRSGTARGTLKGGNLITLSALIGTEWEMRTDGAILFLEDVNEKLYRIDRALTQWLLAGKFKGVRGLILGDFHGLKNRQVYEVLSRQMKIDFPVIHTPCIGHGKNKITLPIGAQVELNGSRKSLILL